MEQWRNKYRKCGASHSPACSAQTKPISFIKASQWHTENSSAVGNTLYMLKFTVWWCLTISCFPWNQWFLHISVLERKTLNTFKLNFYSRISNVCLSLKIICHASISWKYIIILKAKIWTNSYFPLSDLLS